MFAPTDVHHRRKASAWLVLASAALLLGIAALWRHQPSAGLLAYQQRAKPELILGVDKITPRKARLLRMGVLKMSSQFHSPAELAADGEAAQGVFGQACPAPEAALLTNQSPPSTALLPAVDATPAGVTVVSIVCASEDLFDPVKGIVMHPMLRGHASERLAWMSARLGSEMLVQSPVGLRIHGGHSRGAPEKSFTMAFRESYGGEALCPPGLFFGENTPAAGQIILLNAGHYSRFSGALAAEIAALAGCNTSRLTPAVVYLNGTRIKMPYFLYQQQSPAFVTARFGIEHPDWFRLKGINLHISPEFNAMRRWIRTAPAPMPLQEAAIHYEIEDLSAWALAMSFTATTDNNQGSYFKDSKNPDARWRSLTWDMDCAFDDEPDGAGEKQVVNTLDPFSSLDGYRGELFLRLIAESPAYRTIFRKFVQQKLGTTMQRDKLMNLADRYVELATLQTSADSATTNEMRDVRAFLSERHATYTAYIERKLEEATAAQGVLAEENEPPPTMLNARPKKQRM